MNLLGIFLAVGVIVGANLLEGVHPGALLNLPAFLLVICGAFCAAIVQFPFTVILARWLVTNGGTGSDRDGIDHRGSCCVRIVKERFAFPYGNIQGLRFRKAKAPRIRSPCDP